MSFPTMTFNDLRYTHSKQIYNNSSADKNEDYGEFFNMLSNIMDYTKFFNEIPKYKNGMPDYEYSKNAFRRASHGIDYELNRYISQSSMDEDERIMRIIQFFDEVNFLNSRTYVNNELRPILR